MCLILYSYDVQLNSAEKTEIPNSLCSDPTFDYVTKCMESVSNNAPSVESLCRRELQDEFTFVQTALGRIEVDFIRLEVQKNEMKGKLLELEAKETAIAKKLEETHGQGTLDLGTGEFTKQ